MIEQLKTIREALKLSMPRHPTWGEAIKALTQLEAMVGAQEPVAWAVYWGLPPTRQNSVHFDKESAQAVANQIKSATEVRPLYAAPVAQQPLITVEDSLRFRLDCTKEQLEAAEQECAELRAKLKAQQPQADDYKAWYDEAMCASNEAGFVGASAADTIRELARELAALKQPQAEAVPLQMFESDRAKNLMKAWQEGWDACRDSEYVGEEAQNDAFNQSRTLSHCIAEDMLAAPQQAEAVPTFDEQLREVAKRAIPQQAEAVPFNHATQLQIAYVKGLGDGAMQAEAVPLTHVLVPVDEPTDEMIDAACAAVDGMYRVDFVRAYVAAIAQQKGKQ